jgi:hypothetical protein
MALSPVEPLLAAAFLRTMSSQGFNPMAAFFWLQKIAAAEHSERGRGMATENLERPGN